MAKNRNTFAKRQREIEKKRKAQDKRDRRARGKDSPEELDEDGNPIPDDASDEEVQSLASPQQNAMACDAEDIEMVLKEMGLVGGDKD